MNCEISQRSLNFSGFYDDTQRRRIKEKRKEEKEVACGAQSRQKISRIIKTIKLFSNLFQLYDFIKRHGNCFSYYTLTPYFEQEDDRPRDCFSTFISFLPRTPSWLCIDMIILQIVSVTYDISSLLKPEIIEKTHVLQHLVTLDSRNSKASQDWPI